ncbi:tyrosine-protein phosphatase [Listeria booriae]|uniref:Tyrosine-protein phosphatase n=1 Tax=Listeria booriae TaxID=1552123 RepID=A0A099WDE5_9LIST|nr:CpsB/CapC family capsule biosynthesis tyrosine phosphatase [Listeria booriae]KGL42987.1 tyrosine protein phosphatase [Listeria booriae]MBC1227412.1 tyrosine protein phosphatase [Listeria booriae]MBC1234061.1 tyrosine protein phosphatase [Listeria booriae]MBC1246309.1 tyrosine protein phosphatase [Listeria booriae]MBC1287167.1 tyrosine protein phosphatase [Listeria booriae]
MIDIHCHILNQVDDGPKTETASLAMAQQAEAEGFTDIIATPHHLKGDYFNLRPSVVEHVAELNSAIKDNDINITVHVGQEIRLHGEIIEGLKNGDLASLAGSRYALIEFPTQSIPVFTEQLFYDLQMAGYVPVIAHPERNFEIMENPERLYEFVSHGALAQLTWSSLDGKFGKKSKKSSEILLENQLVHFLATDAHDTTRRPLLHKEIEERLVKKIGANQVQELKDNAIKVLKNDIIVADDYTVPSQKRFFLF